MINYYCLFFSLWILYITFLTHTYLYSLFEKQLKIFSISSIPLSRNLCNTEHNISFYPWMFLINVARWFSRQTVVQPDITLTPHLWYGAARRWRVAVSHWLIYINDKLTLLLQVQDWINTAFGLTHCQPLSCLRQLTKKQLPAGAAVVDNRGNSE